jgi:hypothetical protein
VDETVEIQGDRVRLPREPDLEARVVHAEPRSLVVRFPADPNARLPEETVTYQVQKTFQDGDSQIAILGARVGESKG